jgi:hypothetical protein
MSAFPLWEISKLSVLPRLRAGLFFAPRQRSDFGARFSKSLVSAAAFMNKRHESDMEKRKRGRQMRARGLAAATSKQQADCQQSKNGARSG